MGRALALDPAFAEAHRTLIRIEVSTGEHEEAVAAMHRFVSIACPPVEFGVWNGVDTDPLPGSMPTVTGLSGGTFSSLPAGLALNASDGTIDIASSTPGPYSVTYTTAGVCPASSSQSVDIIVCDDGLFCNGVETCNGVTGTCQPGTAPCVTPPVCSETWDECLTGSCSPIVRDDFDVSSFANNDGPDSWLADWIEDDPAIGGVGPGAGSVQVGGGLLQLNDYPYTGLEPSIARGIDLSTTSGVATLRITFSTTPSIQPSDEIVVEVSTNGGTSYSGMDVITGITGAVTDGLDLTLSPYLGPNTRIRIRVSGGYADIGDLFHVHHVQVDSCAVPAELIGFSVE